MVRFEFVPHTADIAVRATAADLAGLMRAEALGLAAAIADREDLQAHRVPGVDARPIESGDAPDDEGLLVTFLNELIYQGETNGEVYTDVEIESWSLEGGVRALAYPDPALEAVHSVKAATYYDLHVERDADGVTATVVFDV